MLADSPIRSLDAPSYKGVLPVLKPPGMSSHDVVAYLRRLLGERKVGHCGTLDPIATGVLVVCLGSATGASEHLMGMPKEYRAEVAFGVETDTLDFAGSIAPVGGGPRDHSMENTAPVGGLGLDGLGLNGLGRDQISRVLSLFEGPQAQTPPMHSALKVGGRRLYELAREGANVERAPRAVEIYGIRLVGYDCARARAVFDVRCSKGTYVRSLCRDIGAALGVPACMSFLMRTRSSGFTADAALTLEQIERLHASGALAGRVVPVGEALAARYGAVHVGEAQGVRFCNGGAVEADEAVADGGVEAVADGGVRSDADGGVEGVADGEPMLLRVYCGSRFLGLGRLSQPASPGRAAAPRPAAVQPVRVFA